MSDLYRKLPKTIKAWRYRIGATMPTWLYVREDVTGWEDHDAIFIDTLEGTMRANLGDWIILGIKGEVYPCKDDVFRDTYEKV